MRETAGPCNLFSFSRALSLSVCCSSWLTYRPANNNFDQPEDILLVRLDYIGSTKQYENFLTTFNIVKHINFKFLNLGLHNVHFVNKNISNKTIENGVKLLNFILNKLLRE